MTRTDCPSAAALSAFHRGELPEPALEEVADHLEACARCEAAVRALYAEPDPVVTALRNLADTVPPPAPPPGTAPLWVDGHEILGELGRGGMGVVYKARHAQLGRAVALKMLLGGGFAGEEDRERFRAEARAVARLQHPNIVQVFDVGEWRAGTGGPPLPYFTLEFVGGGSLGDHLAGKPQPPTQSARWLLTLARAVHYAHAHGVIHRDLKPSNVLLTGDGQLKLCDFGVAKLLTGTDLKTLSGLLVGTPEYMAPEQAMGNAHAVGPAADIYALGAVLYTCLTGRPPLQGATVLETLMQVRTRDAVRPSRLQPGVPRDLDTICLKCLEKEPSRRYANAGELADDLERFLDGQTIRARPAGVVERGWKWARRRPAVAGLLAAVALLLAISLPTVTWLWIGEKQARQDEATERRRAEEASREADERLRQARYALYASYIAQANTQLQAYAWPDADRALEQCRPEVLGADLRSWEWHYLRHQGRADLFPGRCRHGTQKWQQVFDLAFTPDGRHLLSVAGVPLGRIGNAPGEHRITPGEVIVWDAASGERLENRAPHGGAVHGVAVSPDGGRIVTGGADGRIILRDAAHGTDQALVPATEARPEVWGVRFSPDGRWLAVGADRIWVRDEAGDGTWQSLPGSGWEAPLAFSPDRRRLLTGRYTEEKSLPPLLWDLEAGKELAHDLPPGVLTAAAFSPDGRFLGVAYQKSDRVALWDSAARHQLGVLTGHTAAVLAVAFGPPGRYPWAGEGDRSLVATAGDDQTVRLWDAETRTPLLVLLGHEQGVSRVVFSPDGRRLASGDKRGVVKVWDLTRNPYRQVVRPLRDGPQHSSHGEDLGELNFRADGQLQVVQKRPEPAVRRFDSGTGELLAEHALPLYQDQYNPERRLAFSPDGRFVAGRAASDLQVIKIWDAATGVELGALPRQPYRVMALAFSPDGGRLATVAFPTAPPGVAAEVVLWEVSGGRELGRLAAPPLVASLAFSPDGQRLALAANEPRPGEQFSKSTPAQLRLYDLNRKEELLRLLVSNGLVTALAFHPDGQTLAAVGYNTGEVRVVDLKSGRERYTLTMPSHPTGVAFSPDGRRLAVTGFENLVRLYDATTGDRFLTLQGLGQPGSGHYNFTARVAFSPDGRRVAANSWDGTVTIWDAGAARP